MTEIKESLWWSLDESDIEVSIADTMLFNEIDKLYAELLMDEVRENITSFTSLML